MKIIRVDNYDREGPGHDDVLVASDVHVVWAIRIAEFLNKDERDPNTPYFFKAVSDNYKLHKFEP